MCRAELMRLARQMRECARCEMCSDCPEGDKCDVQYKIAYAVGPGNKHGQLIAALVDYIDELEAIRDGKYGKL